VRIAPVVVAVLLAILLQWAIARTYADLVVELFGGTRALHPPSAAAIAIGYAFTCITSAAVAIYCERRSGPSRVLLVVHLIAIVIPMQALVAANFEYARTEFASAVALAFLGALILAASTPDLLVGRASTTAQRSIILLAGALTLYVYGALITHGGAGRFSLDLARVYDVREEFLANLAPLAGYLVPWQGLVLNPALMLVSLERRSLTLGLVALLLQVLLFGMTGFRQFLLMPGLLLGMYFIGGRRHFAQLALTGIMLMLGAAIALYIWLDAPVIPALLVDRVIVVPAEIHYWYYDFFAIHGHAPLQLSQSTLAALSTSHYKAPIAEIIAGNYMGENAWANVGLFADAFANFGFAGCAIFALLFALVLKVLDAVSRAAGARVAAALIAVQAFQLVNVGLLTALLSNGLALAIVVLWILPPSQAVREAG
jgi:hypothetical protein